MLWALAILFHLAGNGAHLLAFDRIGLVQVVLAAVAAVMLIRPSTGVATGLAGLYLLVLWLKLPVVGNHEVILGLVSLVVLLSGLRAGPGLGTDLRFGTGSGPVGGFGPRWLREVAPAARWVLIVSYGFIAVSKLNSGFFNPVESCALVFSEAFGSAFGLGSGLIEAAGPAAIVVTAAVELAIPVLLVLRPVRTAGAILAMVFHFVLALDPASHVWDFSAVLLPLFLLFLGPEVHRRLDAAVARVSRRPPRERILALGTLMAGHMVVSNGATPLPTWSVAYPIWLVVGLAVGAVGVAGAVGVVRTDGSVGVVRSVGGVSAASASAGERRPGRVAGRLGPALGWRPPAMLVPVIVVAVLVGLGPYLGYRTAAAFNMYSNLQVVDGRSNHYLIGSPAPGSWLSGVAGGRSTPGPSVLEVVSADEDSPLQYYIDHGLALPVENLERYLADVGLDADPDPDAAADADAVMVRRSGVVLSATEAGLSATERPRDLRSRLRSTLRHKLAFRRAVDLSPSPQCLRAWGPIG